MDAMTGLVFAAALITVGTLVAGISAMATNGRIGNHTSEEWMVLRVAAQATALLFLFLSQLT